MILVLSTFIYNVFIGFYGVGARVISPWNPKAKLWLQGRKNVLDRIRSLFNPGNDEVIWMHAASLGEFEQGRPVLEKIRLQYPRAKIVISFFSPSGYEVMKDYPGADFITYLPVDSRKNAKEFVRLINPKLVLWIKYEYWYYFLAELKEKGIPVLLVSAVFYPDYVFLKWYGGLHRKMMECFSHVFVQNEESKKLLSSIGIAENITVSRDTRFDRVIEIAEKTEPFEVIEEFIQVNSPLIIAGSTWEEDEEELDHYANSHPEIKFIIAPHEINEERLKEVESLFRRSIRYSVLQAGKSNAQNPKPNTSLPANSAQPAANVL